MLVGRSRIGAGADTGPADRCRSRTSHRPSAWRQQTTAHRPRADTRLRTTYALARRSFGNFFVRVENYELYLYFYYTLSYCYYITLFQFHLSSELIPSSVLTITRFFFFLRCFIIVIIIIIR